MKKTQLLSLSGLFLICTLAVKAQVNTPSPSPQSTIIQKVGISEVKIEYSRPSMKGRKVFGDLVSYNKIWRTGANAPTKLTFGDSMIVAGKKLAPGSYALYTIPNPTEWTIILGKNANTPAGDHKEADDAVRFKVPVTTLTSAVESFTIELANLTRFSADVLIRWEKTSTKFTITNDADRKIMSDFKAKMESVDLYWQAANYYYDNDKDINLAFEYINKVVEKNPQFWTVHAKAKIQAKLNDCKGAIETAQKSIELAKAANNEDYVKLNQKLIDECNKGGKK